ncbi:MAG: hypothetical protein A3A94_00145 [Candidatus Portnoybacteria bacterium RIFCSPLOWO2_01_FULL_43_11]|uniref:Membrane transport protein MMPL domain-containing protein n=2 Tax=Bacteria candidate phyla TaxID=1783234 RepID=A0A1G2FLB7_9BACT|nr:MAG: hypothetical protein A2713_00680 [candidate division WWE3 bacterium RIFCSPHIGHO2_01_FULL_35_17]OGZ38311.1 MAG: hypothetical protein A3A94_00145 [Candidatus Portnoybacteria bacterium RIFCSPLOWO2_01_FULL_43_11]
MKRIVAGFGLISIFLAVVFLGFQASQLEYGWVLEGGLPKYLTAQKEFDWVIKNTPQWAFDTVVIGLYNPGPEGVFDPALLEAVAEITEEARKLSGFGDVMSLATYRKVKNVLLENGELELKTDYLIKEIPQYSKEMARLKEDILTEPKLIGPGRLISSSRKATAIILELKTNMGWKGQKNYGQIEVTQWLESIRTKYEEQGIKVYFYGAPYLRTHIDKELMGFMRIAIIAVVMIIPLIASLVFGFSTRLILLLSSGILATIIATIGLSTLIGAKMNVISSVGLVIAPAVFGSYAIQFLARYFELGKEKINQTFSDVRWALILSAGTSLCGFLPLTIVPLVAIKDYSTFSSLAVGAGLILSLTLIPLFLILFPFKSKGNGIEKALGKALSIILGIRPKIILMGMGILLLFGLGIFLLEIRSNPSKFFPEKDEIQQDLSFFRKEFGATGKISLILEFFQKDGAVKPAVLSKIEKIQEKMEGVNGIASAIAITDIVKILNQQVSGRGDKEFYFLPLDPSLIRQLLFLFNADDITEDYLEYRANQQLKIDFWCEATDSLELRKLYHHLKKEAGRLFKDTDIKFFIYGDWILWSFEDPVAVYWKLGCVGLTCLLLLLSQIRFRDWRMTGFCLIPPLVANIVIFGIMGILGIHLEIASATLATIVFGMGADSPIHYFERHLICRNIKKTHLSIGSPLVVYTLMMIAGFLPLTFAHLTPLRNLGLLIIAALSLNVGLTIFLAPHFLEWLNKRR